MVIFFQIFKIPPTFNLYTYSHIPETVKTFFDDGPEDAREAGRKMADKDEVKALIKRSIIEEDIPADCPKEIEAGDEDSGIRSIPPVERWKKRCRSCWVFPGDIAELDFLSGNLWPYCDFLSGKSLVTLKEILVSCVHQDDVHEGV